MNSCCMHVEALAILLFVHYFFKSTKRNEGRWADSRRPDSHIPMSHGPLPSNRNQEEVFNPVYHVGRRHPDRRRNMFTGMEAPAAGAAGGSRGSSQEREAREQQEREEAARRREEAAQRAQEEEAAASRAREEAANREREQEEARRQEERRAADRAREEEAAASRAREEAATRERDEAATREREQEEARRQEERRAADRAREEEAAASRAREEREAADQEARRREQEEAARRQEQEAAEARERERRDREAADQDHQGQEHTQTFLQQALHQRGTLTCYAASVCALSARLGLHRRLRSQPPSPEAGHLHIAFSTALSSLTDGFLARCSAVEVVTRLNDSIKMEDFRRFGPGQPGDRYSLMEVSCAGEFVRDLVGELNLNLGCPRKSPSIGGTFF